jgi:peptidoglycan hydrolase-like protein with peptidoglycan-binding domain
MSSIQRRPHTTNATNASATDVAIAAIDGHELELDIEVVDVDSVLHRGFEAVATFTERAPRASSTTTFLHFGAKGPAVRALQEELVRTGYSLPSGIDSRFGDDVKRAVQAFQMEHALEPTGAADAATVAALRTTPDAQPAFAAFAADGVLSTTIGVGYDEDHNDLAVRTRVLDGLKARGFAELNVANFADAGLKKLGLDPARIDRDARYFTRDIVVDGQPTTALVKFVDRDSVRAPQQFTEALMSDDVVLYTGHGRYGSGPDFDDIGNAAGNVVLGKPSGGHVALSPSVLSTTTLGQAPRVLFFDACNSDRYLDDLRRSTSGTATIDVLASTTELPWSTSSHDVLAVLDGVLNGGTLSSMQHTLEQQNGAGSFTHERLRGAR